MSKYNIISTLYTLNQPQLTYLNQSKLSLLLFNHMSCVSTILNLQNKQVILVSNNIFKYTIDK